MEITTEGIAVNAPQCSEGCRVEIAPADEPGAYWLQHGTESARFDDAGAGVAWLRMQHALAEERLARDVRAAAPLDESDIEGAIG